VIETTVAVGTEPITLAEAKAHCRVEVRQPVPPSGKV
jgi:hypothetical protein